jgi:hypothetical protein
VVFISQTLILRDADLNIIDTIELDPGVEITRGDVRDMVRLHGAEVIERVTTIERRPS